MDRAVNCLFGMWRPTLNEAIRQWDPTQFVYRHRVHIRASSGLSCLRSNGARLDVRGYPLPLVRTRPPISGRRRLGYSIRETAPVGFVLACTFFAGCAATN